MNGLSVVIPTYNEEGSIIPLLRRIHTTLSSHEIPYEVIVIDDHSKDDTVVFVSSLTAYYPVTVYKKLGEKGKATSLLEGFSHAKYDWIAMIDADLQYPPEDLLKMLEKTRQYDIIVANRTQQHTSIARKITSRGFMLLFANILHKMNCDVQSGLKVFRKEILDRITLSPTQWTFDLEFLVKARNAGYSITTTETIYHDREHGISHVKIIPAIIEIGSSALRLKFSQTDIFHFTQDRTHRKGQGFHYKGDEFVTHTNLDLQESAFFRLTHLQKTALLALILILILATIVDWHSTWVATIALLTTLYFADMVFNLFLIIKSFHSQRTDFIPHMEFDNTVRTSWPLYTIFCPLYKEWEILPQFIQSIQQLDYPKDRLQVLLLLEENDSITISKARQIPLPDYFNVVIVPHSLPKTKPKACNYGLRIATGEYSVIYDAEDIPERNQLKEAVTAFEKGEQDLACVQAKLSFYNPHQNILTKLFTSEYSLWFDIILSGLQSINAPIPLGGTSNHFKMSVLKKLKGWDSFNVTEDCDLGIRLAKKGYQTVMINSTTYEEANSDTKNWFGQRSRWIKGYLQTYLVHLRNISQFSRNTNILNAVAFQLIVGGKVLSLFINPFMWLLCIIYFAFRPIAGEFIESFYPAPVLYMAVISVVFGNFMYFYYYMIGCAKRGYYNLIIFGFFVPFYWLMMSVAAWIAVYQLIRNPHYWSKTKHGLHLTVSGQKKRFGLGKLTNDPAPQF